MLVYRHSFLVMANLVLQHTKTWWVNTNSMTTHSIWLHSLCGLKTTLNLNRARCVFKHCVHLDPHCRSGDWLVQVRRLKQCLSKVSTKWKGAFALFARAHQFNIITLPHSTLLNEMIWCWHWVVVVVGGRCGNAEPLSWVVFVRLTMPTPVKYTTIKPAHSHEVRSKEMATRTYTLSYTGVSCGCAGVCVCVYRYFRISPCTILRFGKYIGAPFVG